MLFARSSGTVEKHGFRKFYTQKASELGKPAGMPGRMVNPWDFALWTDSALSWDGIKCPESRRFIID